MARNPIKMDRYFAWIELLASRARAVVTPQILVGNSEYLSQ